MKKKDIKKMNIVIVILIIILIIFGGIAILRDYFKKAKNYYTYKGVNDEYTFETFKIENKTFHLIRVYAGEDSEVKEYKISLHYGPYEVEDIHMEDNLKDKVIKDWIYLTQDPDLQNRTGGRALLALLEVGRVTGTSDYGVYKISTQAAFTMENEEVKSVPVKNCSNANKNIAVVEVRLGNETKVYSENECVIIMGKDREELVKAADKLTLHLLGVF